MMKHTKMVGKMALIALAAACLLAVPALSMPMGDGSCRSGPSGMFGLKSNLTPEEMDNMTLAELKEMNKEALNQSQSCPAMGEGQSCGQNGRKGKPMMGSMMGGDGPQGMGAMRDGSDERGQMHMGEGCCRSGPGGMFGLKSNLTPEEMDNMTLAELKEMQKEALNQSQSCRAMGEGQSCVQNGRRGEPMMGPMMDRDGAGGQKMGGNEHDFGHGQGAGRADGAMRGGFAGNAAILLMDDLKEEDLANMTVSQVRDLIQTKMQELDNMTLGQIKQLKKEKMQSRENLTIAELKEENKNRREMAGMLGLAGLGPHLPA